MPRSAFNIRLIGIAVVCGGVAWAAAQPPGPVHVRHAELLAKVEKTANGLATSTLPTGSSAIVIAVHREKSGEVEVHDTQEDIFVAQEGRSTVVVGTAAGMRSSGAGEWRGGTIKEERRFDLAPGDVLWIPAGLAHQMLLPAGGSFNYLAIKFNTKPAS
jgi:mannose-6-phosphate isomerase-like protein (cupin superfamily)